jgi:type IV pilus assembly protein PilQ
MMKKILAVSIAAALLGQNPLLAFAVESATVQSVRVSADSVYIATDRPVEYKAFTTEEPPRLVLELLDSRLKTLQDIPVGGATLRKVRTGQFQTTPSSISRVVMDLSQKTAYEITRKGTELVVMFGSKAPRPSAPAVKDAPAAQQKVKVITPDPASEKPVIMTLEPAPIKPSEVNRESAPAFIAPRRSAASSSSRSIMDSLPRDPITLDYSEADVREVIDMLAAKAGINIIYSDDVTGTLTISLTKVPFEEAFKTVLSVKGFAAQQAGDNILRIAAPNTLLAEQKKALPQTRVFFLNYSKAAEVKVQLEAVSTAEGRTSARYTTDDSNNAVIVTDTQFGLDSTARLIRSLDRVPKQVMIEVKLVEVALDHSFDLGFNWNFNNAGGATVGTVNLPGPTPAGNTYGGSLTFFGKISDLSYNTVIAAAVKKGKLKVLSDPKVATLNNKAATINIVDQVPYTTKDSSVNNGTVTTSDKVTYVPSGITLSVTPTINSDGRIAMHLEPSVSQASGGTATTPPQTNTRSTNTNVIVKNGETIVIGGMIRDSQSEQVYKVPILGDIPLLGILFRKKSTARNRMELLIFVTPKILED